MFRWLITIACFVFFTRAAVAQPLSLRFETVSSGAHPASVGRYLCQNAGLNDRDRLCRRHGSVASLLRRTRAAEERFNEPLLQPLLALLCANAGEAGPFTLIYKGSTIEERPLRTCQGDVSVWLALSSADAETAIRRLLPSGISPRYAYLRVKRNHTLRLPRFVSPAPIATPVPPSASPLPTEERSFVRASRSPIAARPDARAHPVSTVSVTTRTIFVLRVLANFAIPPWLLPFLALLLGLLCWKAGETRGFTRGEAVGRARGRDLAIQRVAPALEENGLSIQQIVALPSGVYRTPASSVEAPTTFLGAAANRASDPEKTPYASSLMPVFHAETPALGLPLGTALTNTDAVLPIEDGLELRRTLLPRPVRQALDGLDALAREVARLFRAHLPDGDLRKTLLADPTASAADVLRLLIDVASEHDTRPCKPSFFTPAPPPFTVSAEIVAHAPAPSGTYSHRQLREEVVIIPPPPGAPSKRPCKEWAATFGASVPPMARALLTTMAVASPERQADLVWRLAATLLRHVAKEAPSGEAA